MSLLTISKPSVKAVLDIFWASQASFMLQTAAKRSAMGLRMIWDHVVFEPKNNQKPGFLAKTLRKALPNSSKLGFGDSKTLKNTQKHSKTLKNTPNMPETTLVTPKGTQGSLQNSKFRKKTQKFLCKGPKTS